LQRLKPGALFDAVQPKNMDLYVAELAKFEGIGFINRSVSADGAQLEFVLTA